MENILFSYWAKEVTDNRGKDKSEYKLPKKGTLPEEFRPNEPIKAFMGWDGFMIRDPEVNIVEMCRAYMEAVQKESCGKCMPCRIGTRVLLDTLTKITEGKGEDEDLDIIKSLAQSIREGSKCQIGQTGPIPIISAIEYFRDDFEKAIKEKKKIPRGNFKYKLTAPCISACPSHLDIPKYIEMIKEGNFVESLKIIREGTCLPGTLGRVCIRPCESNCRRLNLDESLSIKYLKRFVADYEIEKKNSPIIDMPEVLSGEKVAVIGAGPAGLSCAYYLALKGHPVTIFERLGEPGGMAAVGIPDYRLPRHILRREVDIITSTGVEIKYNTNIGDDIKITDLKEEGYKAIFIGVGAQNSTSARVKGEDEGYKGFIPGVKYLLDINMGKDPYPEGNKVVVVGGGNVAIDCVRCSFRVGKKDVHLVYRRTRKEMPADDVEIKDAEEEGVVFHFLANPTKILAKDGKVIGVECIKMELGEPDESGRRRPIPIEGSEFFMDTDIVVPAIGQAVDLSFLEEKDGVETTRWNTIIAKEDTFETSAPGIFSAGDCVTGPDVLVRAAGNGRKTAEKIHQYLTEGKVTLTDNDIMENLIAEIKPYDKDEDVGLLGGRKRLHLKALPPEVRKWTFDEVEQGFKVTEAMKEASRCLRCYRIGLFAI
ncbi:MAG: dihydropyrimidine dehydrogenase subunit A [Spirochaetes bacterium]|nr:MAG: dihydropyrimidine dehydrogenase subunit A [Spirochaetota bacterium]